MRTLTLPVWESAGVAVVGSVEFVNEFETVKLTVVSAPGARFVYGLDVASAVTLGGRVSVTVPLCAVAPQLWTSTGSVNVSPTPVDWIAAERPRRRASGAVFSSQLSNSAQLPQRWKRPSTGETTLTTWSV